MPVCVLVHTNAPGVEKRILGVCHGHWACAMATGTDFTAKPTTTYETHHTEIEPMSSSTTQAAPVGPEALRDAVVKFEAALAQFAKSKETNSKVSNPVQGFEEAAEDLMFYIGTHSITSGLKSPTLRAWLVQRLDRSFEAAVGLALGQHHKHVMEVEHKRILSVVNAGQIHENSVEKQEADQDGSQKRKR